MHILLLAVRSLVYYLRMNVVLALGVAAATAVLVGALLVGDSVKGSLRELTIDRLGRIDELLVVERFFRNELVSELAASPGFQDDYERAVGVVFFPNGTAERRGESGTLRSSNVLVVGSEGSSFWDFDTTGTRPQKTPALGEVILNRPLADELHAEIGDTVTLRLPKPEDIPADSPLGEKTDLIRNLPGLKVVDIVAAKGLGRFALARARCNRTMRTCRSNSCRTRCDRRDESTQFWWLARMRQRHRMNKPAKLWHRHCVLPSTIWDWRSSGLGWLFPTAMRASHKPCLITSASAANA